jgi:hypothetical protein
VRLEVGRCFLAIPFELHRLLRKSGFRRLTLDMATRQSSDRCLSHACRGRAGWPAGC